LKSILKEFIDFTIQILQLHQVYSWKEQRWQPKHEIPMPMFSTPLQIHT